MKEETVTRSLPDEEPEEEMRPAKLLFYALFILALGIYASHALFDGIARTQEAREREQSIITKLELTRVGQNVRVGNSSFLKIAERRGRQMLDRVYGNSLPNRFHDSTSVLLMPGEKARTPYPWPEDDQCPHCGSKGYFERNEVEGVAHCLACGTWCFREILVGHDRNLPFPYRPRKAAREAICPECDRSFRTESLHSDVRCPACRDKRRKRKAAEYRRNSKLEARPDGSVSGRGVKTVVAVNVTQKEAL